MKKMLILALFGLLVGSSFAGCIFTAYLDACSHCSFDENGKMNRSCSESYKQSGIACTSAKYPIMSTKYAAGQCPQVDACTSQMQACINQRTSGSEKADCEGSTIQEMCYATGENCVAEAAKACGEDLTTELCPLNMMVLMLVGLAGFAYYRKN